MAPEPALPTLSPSANPVAKSNPENTAFAIPSARSPPNLYAVIAFAGGWLVWGLGALGMAPVFAVALGAIATILLRVLAIVFNWRLPQWKLGAASD